MLISDFKLNQLKVSYIIISRFLLLFYQLLAIDYNIILLLSFPERLGRRWY